MNWIKTKNKMITLYPEKVFTQLILFTGIVFLLSPLSGYAQQMDLNNIKNTFSQKPFRLGGGISASSVLYTGNDGQGRQPFTYFLSGNINLNIYNQVNLPFTFNITNLGNNFTYPTLPNRLSIHPTYKWVTGHIGDVSMNFSPYTFNGHMFRGIGIDLTPEGKWKFSAMAGRLQKAVEYDSANRLVPAAYQRMGYSAKIRYDQAGYYAGMTFFSAKDDVSSLKWKPDSLNILPKGNVAMSWEGGLKLIPNLSLTGEYALSLLTRDIRSPQEGSSFINNLFPRHTSTQSYTALKGELTYQLLKNTMGIRYERIDPDYATLGAYYFNNDYENVTLNYARPFLKDKITVALSWGAQRDDLNKNQEQTSKRFVSSANVSYTPNEKLNSSFSYSSFQTYLNLKSQFDYINGQTPYDNLDTLNFTQLSQNMSLNSNYNFGKSDIRKHNLNVNMSFQQAADKQGDIIKPGNLSQFYNLSTAYNLIFVPQAISIQTAFNATYNYINSTNSVILGPTLGIRAKVYQKKITTGISSAYNVSINESDTQGKVLNLRWNAAYAFYKKHNLNANTIWQNRKISGKNTTDSFTATIAYSYSF
ncbi:hypothetical protein QNI19_30180 [Cytophagaceae bacterium DM2B3-1]|uniref:Uncharacterized protein n=1 Tax=Xanthocytophaga flava TaxID=3048013 RepID=A0ABT7CU62_9BACT|nr:hypothetical protein [Xanthocytophaga flavus]MDJ1497245.1 hypothetical protein [Xanthocytophaga flavus]